VPIQQKIANSYSQTFKSGRTQPGVFLCSDDVHTTCEPYVVKFRSRVNGNNTGLFFEIMATQLANHFLIYTPKCAIIEICSDLVHSITNDQDLHDRMKNSVGLNFGSKLLTGGVSTWISFAGMTAEQIEQITKIYLFDALIENPDRRKDKPNLLIKEGKLYVIDHESAFAFYYAIGGKADYSFLRRHLFYDLLRNKYKDDKLDYIPFFEKLNLLSDELIEEMSDGIPEEWKRNPLSKVIDHLKRVRDNQDNFIKEINGEFYL